MSVDNITEKKNCVGRVLRFVDKTCLTLRQPAGSTRSEIHKVNYEMLQKPNVCIFSPLLRINQTSLHIAKECVPESPL